MRIDSDVLAEFLVPEGNSRQRDDYVQASDAATMEKLVGAKLAEVAKLNLAVPLDTLWRSLFVDLAGAGDGHVFMTRIYSSGQGPLGDEVSESEGGVDPALLRMFFYSAAQSEALDAAVKKAKQRIGELLTALEPVGDVVENVSIRQTGLAGASQGTQVCGFLLVKLLTNPPVISGVTVGANITIDGTLLQSVLPNTQTLVVLSGPGITAGTQLITQQQILDAGGSISPTQIVFPASLVVGTFGSLDTAQVFANGVDNASNQFTLP